MLYSSFQNEWARDWTVQNLLTRQALTCLLSVQISATGQSIHRENLIVAWVGSNLPAVCAREWKSAVQNSPCTAAAQADEGHAGESVPLAGQVGAKWMAPQAARPGCVMRQIEARGALQAGGLCRQSRSDLSGAQTLSDCGLCNLQCLAWTFNEKGFC